jgi:hypothetical protein
MFVDESFIPYRLAAHYLWNLLHDEGIEFPLIGIVCGSGLSELSKALEGKTRTVKYSEIPGYVCPKAVCRLVYSCQVDLFIIFFLSSKVSSTLHCCRAQRGSRIWKIERYSCHVFSWKISLIRGENGPIDR